MLVRCVNVNKRNILDSINLDIGAGDATLFRTRNKVQIVQFNRNKLVNSFTPFL